MDSVIFDFNKEFTIILQADVMGNRDNVGQVEDWLELAMKLVDDALSGNIDGLDRAIILLGEGINTLDTTDTWYLKALTYLGVALWTRFNESGRQSDLDNSILLFRQSLEP